MTSTTIAPALSPTGRETVVLTVGPASTDHFVHLVETFGEATRSACRSLVLDLEKPRAREVVHRLVRDADVFLTNLTQPRREKYGLD